MWERCDCKIFKTRRERHRSEFLANPKEGRILREQCNEWHVLYQGIEERCACKKRTGIERNESLIILIGGESDEDCFINRWLCGGCEDQEK